MPPPRATRAHPGRRARTVHEVGDDPKEVRSIHSFVRVPPPAAWAEVLHSAPSGRGPRFLLAGAQPSGFCGWREGGRCGAADPETSECPTQNGSKHPEWVATTDCRDHTSEMTAGEKLEKARSHLERVLAAWDPPDWADLSLYGFYALEAAVEAACLHLGIATQKAHWARVEAARVLHQAHGLADVSELLRDLNETRKSEAYGDVQAPELDAEDVATDIELYVEAVATLLRA